MTACPASATSADLADLRATLDALDDTIHDTLMRRAETVARIAALPVKGRTPLRPGREAAIIRRLLARHRGPLPAIAIVRVWRELIAGFTAQQRPMLVSICRVDDDPDYLAAAREHFGALVPVRLHRTPAQAINDVSAGVATAAVLPAPAEGEPARTAWWTALLPRDDPRIHVVARLPFWSARPEGAPKVQALVVSVAAPDASGDDRSLLGLEMARDTSRARLTTAVADAGFDAGPIIVRRDGDATQALVDVAGFVADADSRLAALRAVSRPPVVLGAYAVPLRGYP